MQTEILEKHLEAELEVLAVWLPIMHGDSLVKVDETLLRDARVSRYWDEEQVSGRWFAENLGGFPKGALAWDVFYLFEPEATWEATPAPLLAMGRPIFHQKTPLQTEITKLLSMKLSTNGDTE